MAAPVFNTHEMYSVIAETMPTEGRDFSLDVAVQENQRIRVTVTPLTPVGRGFVPTLLERLADRIPGTDFVAGQDTADMQEPRTINEIRARIAQDETAALRAKLREMQDRAKKLADDMRREDQARAGRAITEEAAQKQADYAATLSRLNVQKRQIEFMLEHINEARTQVNAASSAAAAADAELGKDWSTDLDAPLTSLFDRQDATEKLKTLERYTQQVAAHMFMLADIKNNAAAVGKQYIMQRK